jgi:hypothetical protein
VNLRVRGPRNGEDQPGITLSREEEGPKEGKKGEDYPSSPLKSLDMDLESQLFEFKIGTNS